MLPLATRRLRDDNPKRTQDGFNITKRIGIREVLPLLILILFAETGRGEVSVVATLTSDYVYRGFSLSDGNPAAQVGVDWQDQKGWFLGAWTTTVDIQTQNGQRDWELDLYGGYRFGNRASRWSAALTALRYTYPGASGFDYDYTEWLASLYWGDHLSFDVAFTNDYFGRDATARFSEINGQWGLDGGWTFSGTVGWADVPFWGGEDYWFGHLGFSRPFGVVTVDVRFYENTTPTDRLRQVSAGSELVLSVSTGF